MRNSKLRRVVVAAAGSCMVGVGLSIQALAAEPLAVETLASKQIPGAAALIIKPSRVEDSFVAIAQSDPVAAFRAALKRYESKVDDYTCTFEKQERIGGRLTAEQVTQIRFREKPFSVNMLWIQNEDKARRVVYVEGRWTGKHGERMAVVEPAGSVARLFVHDVLRPIDGEEARRAARKTIDQFGFANTLRRIVTICDLATKNHELDIRYKGESTFGGRPTYLFERRLPYSNDNGIYPDRLLVVHLDREHLVPVSCCSFADEEKSQLLGKYVTKDMRFNVGLTDSDFARNGR
jgi:hypothetical protein